MNCERKLYYKPVMEIIELGQQAELLSESGIEVEFGDEYPKSESDDG